MAVDFCRFLVWRKMSRSNSKDLQWAGRRAILHRDLGRAKAPWRTSHWPNVRLESPIRTQWKYWASCHSSTSRWGCRSTLSHRRSLSTTNQRRSRSGRGSRIGRRLSYWIDPRQRKLLQNRLCQRRKWRERKIRIWLMSGSLKTCPYHYSPASNLSQDWNSTRQGGKESPNRQVSSRGPPRQCWSALPHKPILCFGGILNWIILFVRSQPRPEPNGYFPRSPLR